MVYPLLGCLLLTFLAVIHHSAYLPYLRAGAVCPVLHALTVNEPPPRTTGAEVTSPSEYRRPFLSVTSNMMPYKSRLLYEDKVP